MAAQSRAGRRVHPPHEAGDLPADWNDRVAKAYGHHPGEGRDRRHPQGQRNWPSSALVSTLPERVGGSADLTGSNLRQLARLPSSLHRNPGGNYISYGVREFGMSHIMNGMALHGGIFPFGGTFLMFSEYARNALRMSALMKQRVVYVFTHDSIGLGEDGPTHQPVEQTATLRMIPNMTVWRPCDTTETLVAWAASVEKKDGPSCHILSRQNLPFVKRSDAQIADIRKGGYVLSDAADAKVVLIATGSEVELALKAQEALKAEGIAARVVSMPSTNVFDKQDKAYKDSVLLPTVHKVAIEAGVTDGWWKYVGLRGAVIGLDRFGESAPAPQLFKEFGFTVENVVSTVKGIL
jgi:transketolase